MLRPVLPVLFLTAALGVTSAFAQNVPTRVGNIPVIGAAQIFIAQSEGLLKGLDVKFTTFESGPLMIQALASGSIDVYVAGVAPLAVARSKGVDVKVVTTTAINENTVAASQKLAAFFKPGVAPAQALKDFRAATGKAARIATQPPGSVPHTTLMHYLVEMIKADKADYEIVTLGIDATQQALLAKAVDAAILREPAITIARQRDPGITVVALGDQLFPSQPGTVVAVSGAYLAKYPQAVQTIVDGIVAATKIAETDPKRAAPPIEAALGKGIVDTATILAALASPSTKFMADPRKIVEPFKAMQAFQVKLGTLDKEYPLEGLFEPSFYVKAAGTKAP